MSQNYKMIIQYEGTRYDGWQKQGNTENTIQGKLEKVLERMAGFPVEVHGSGRTDAGVHAAGQVANFHLPDGWKRDMAVKNESVAGGKQHGNLESAGKNKTVSEWIRAYLNQYLPDDIAITELTPVPERFHSRLSAVKKIYTYRIETGEKRDVFSRRICYGLGQALDVKKMQTAADLLCGTHDYKSFCGNKKMKKSTVRNIMAITIVKKEEQVEITITGNGFLQNMVRIIVGTLVEVGLGKRSVESVGEALESRDREQTGYTISPRGLALVGVDYE